MLCIVRFGYVNITVVVVVVVVVFGLAFCSLRLIFVSSFFSSSFNFCVDLMFDPNG